MRQGQAENGVFMLGRVGDGVGETAGVMFKRDPVGSMESLTAFKHRNGQCDIQVRLRWWCCTEKLKQSDCAGSSS